MQRVTSTLALCVALLALSLLPSASACRVTQFGCGHRSSPQSSQFQHSCTRQFPAHQYYPSPSCGAYGIIPINYGGCTKLNSAPEDCTVPCTANGNGTIVHFNLESTRATFKILVNGYYLRNDGSWVKTGSCNSPASCNATTTASNFWYNQADAWRVGFGTQWPRTWNKTQTYFASGLQRDATEIYPPYFYQQGASYGCTDPITGLYAPVSGIKGDWPPNYQVLFNSPDSPWNCSTTGINWVVVLAEMNGKTLPNTWAYTRNCSTTTTTLINVLGDPQFKGLRGQDYQVHGVDGGVYNIISDKYMQLNSKFVFLTGPRPCPMIPTTGRKSVACFAHAGSYLGNLALRTDAGDRVLIESGPAEIGLSVVEVNGRTLSIGENVTLAFADGRTGSVAVTSTHEVQLIAGLFEIEMENSDSFLNLRTVLVKGSNWKELSDENAHGLLGQTWNLRKGKSAIEGKVDDYMLMSDDLYGSDFMYNRFGLNEVA